MERSPEVSYLPLFLLVTYSGYRILKHLVFRGLQFHHCLRQFFFKTVYLWKSIETTNEYINHNGFGNDLATSFSNIQPRPCLQIIILLIEQCLTEGGLVRKVINHSFPPWFSLILPLFASFSPSSGWLQAVNLFDNYFILKYIHLSEEKSQKIKQILPD